MTAWRTHHTGGETKITIWAPQYPFLGWHMWNIMPFAAGVFVAIVAYQLMT
jgi:hypothetical protein